MSIRFAVHAREKYVHTEVHGAVDLAQVLGYLDELHAHPDFAPELPRLIDWRGAELLRLGVPEFRTIASALRSGEPPSAGRRAFVGDRDYLFGMLRMHETMLDDAPAEYAVFRTVEEAREWLGIPGAGGAADGAAGAAPPRP